MRPADFRSRDLGSHSWQEAAFCWLTGVQHSLCTRHFLETSHVVPSNLQCTPVRQDVPSTPFTERK